MPGYITFYKFTQQGITNVKDSPERIGQTRALAEQLGIRMVGIWLTMGEYDFVGVFDAPDDQAMAALSLAVARKGNVTTRTMRAFSEEEFSQLVDRLP